MGDQPVPVAVAVGVRLHMAGLVGQDALGGGQGHRSGWCGQPGLAVVGDNGEPGVMEADAVHDGIL
ncbi:hypothetical protein [Aeromonas salmonicida]|uniref:hypothetical protein n=1 Tax=Aeromonas salmonicida TaxID=645 RepID=UPI003D1F32DD